MSELVHVVPTHDCFRHRVYPDDAYCECNPTIKWQENDDIIVTHDHIAKPAPTLWLAVIDFQKEI